MMKRIKIKKSIKGFFSAIFAFVVTLSLLFAFVLSRNSVYAKEDNEVKNDSTPLVDPANCKHDLIEKEITVTDIKKTTNYSGQSIRYSEYKDVKVAGSTGVDLAFMGAQGRTCAEGSAVVTVTINLEESKKIDVYWYIIAQVPYARMKVEFTYSNEETTAETITYDYTNNDFIGWNVNSILCSAGVNKFTYKLYVGKGSKTWADPSGRHLYVLPEFSSAFDENDVCTLCGTKCTHETAGIGYDSAKDEYFFQCRDMCAHEVDIVSYVENRQLIADLRKTYDKFTDEQKEKFPKEKLARLEKAESIIAIADVEDLITKLPSAADVTTNKKKDVYAVRTAFENLKKADKKEVNFELVEKLEAVELALAQKLVEEELAKLPATDKITTSNKGVIEAARAAYDKLNEKQKEKFSKEILENLQKAEASLANAIINEELAKIPDIDKITSQNKASIEAVRKAYDSLSDEDKKKIAPEVLEKLEAAEIALAKAIFNEEIAKLPEVDQITLNHKNSIEAARKAYDSLSDEDKAKISTEKLEKLEAVEKVLANLIINDAAQKLPEAVEDITINDKPTIEAFRKAYESLSDEDKAKIDSELIEKLEAAEVIINDIEKAAEVENIIDELPSVNALTLDDYDAVLSAKAKYESLTEDQKTRVPFATLERLNAIYKKATDIKMANDFETIVDELGEISYNNETKAKLDAALAKYNGLTEDQKALIADEYQQLQAAIKDYEQKELDTTRHSLVDNTTNVSIETSTGRGIPKDVSMSASSSTKVQAKEGTQEYNNIVSKLEGMTIHTVYSIKLTHVVDGVEKEVQPSDIQAEMKLIIRLAIPEGVNQKEARILHIHDQNNMEFVENVKVEGNEFVFEVSSLSEFVIVVMTHGLPAWAVVLIILGALILLCGICYLLLFFVFNKWMDNNGKRIRIFKLWKKDNKVKVLTMYLTIKEIDGKELLETKDEVLEPKEAEKVEKPVEKVEKSVEKPVVEEVIEENEDSEDEEVVVKEIDGRFYRLMYNKSFVAKLIQTSDEAKDYYQTLKNYALSYKDTTSRISWNYDSINRGRINLIKFNIKRKHLYVYFALNADDYADTKYNLVKVESKKYEAVPAMYAVRNDRNLKYAMELIDIVCGSNGIEKGELKNENYYLPYEDTESLLARGLIKEVKTSIQEKRQQVKVRKAVSATEVNDLLSNENATDMIIDARKKTRTGKKGVINVSVLDQNFNDGDTITIEILKERKLIAKNIEQVKVLATGTLTKKLNVELQDYSIEAVKMIVLTGGTVKRV